MSSDYVSLESLAHVITKGTTPTKNQGYEESGINFLRALSIDDNGVLDETTFLKISEKTHESLSRSIVENDDVLISIVGEIGRVAVATTEHLPANLNQQIAIIRPNKSMIYPRFLANFLRTHEIQHLLSSLSVGSVQDNLNLSDLRNLKIEKLDLNEQVSRNKLLDLIDEKYSCGFKMLEIFETIISSLFRSWFIDFDPVKAKSEGKLPYGMNDETAALFTGEIEDSEIGPIPRGWDVLPASSLVSVRRQAPKTRIRRDLLPYIGIEDIPKRKLVADSWRTSDCITGTLSKFEKGDILFSTIRPYFHKSSIAPINGATNQNVLVLKPRKQNQQTYLSVVLTGELAISHAVSYSVGSTMPRVSWDDFGRFLIVLPTPEILSEFNKVVNPVISMISRIVVQSQNLTRLRDELLPKLLSGELEV